MDLILELEKDEYYQSLIEGLPEDVRDEFVVTITDLAQKMTVACQNFDEMISNQETLLDFINELGEGINRRAFAKTPGVTEIEWPTTKQD